MLFHTFFLITKIALAVFFGVGMEVEEVEGLR
jgi:hypothetical protein